MFMHFWVRIETHFPDCVKNVQELNERVYTVRVPIEMQVPLFPISTRNLHSTLRFTYGIFFFCPYLSFFSTRVVPVRFQAVCRRRRPNQALVCLLILCYRYFLVKVNVGVLLYFV